MSNINQCWAQSGRMSIYRLDENANLSHQVLSNLIDHHILCGMRKLKENRVNYKDLHRERRQKTWIIEDDTGMLFPFSCTHFSGNERRKRWPCEMIFCKMRHNGAFLSLFGCREYSAGVIQLNYRDLYCDTLKQAIVVLLTLLSDHWPRRNERIVSTFSCSSSIEPAGCCFRKDAISMSMAEIISKRSCQKSSSLLWEKTKFSCRSCFVRSSWHLVSHDRRRVIADEGYVDQWMLVDRWGLSAMLHSSFMRATDTYVLFFLLSSCLTYSLLGFADPETS